MILINCAACAAPLAHTAPRCIRCQTRYCNKTCQHDHWRRGHKQMCKKIHRGGNAEQYNADKKYKEAVAEAVEACAEDTKGEKCYICLEAVHPNTGEGLVHGCGCQGPTAYAHVSCLVRHLHGWEKIDCKKMKESRQPGPVTELSDDTFHYLDTLLSCKLCKKKYTGVVMRALGWGIWKMHASKPDSMMYHDSILLLSMALYDAGSQDEAMEVLKASHDQLSS